MSIAGRCCWGTACSRRSVDAQSPPGAGSTFRVFLSAVGKTASTEIPISSQPGISGGQDRTHAAILVVDDEAMVRKMASAALRRQGYEVLEAENGRDALEVLAAANSPPSLALVDLAMPVMGGDELVPILHQSYEGLKIVVTGGYAEEDARKRLSNAEIAGFLQKPYTVHGLAGKVSEVLQNVAEPRRQVG